MNIQFGVGGKFRATTMAFLSAVTLSAVALSAGTVHAPPALADNQLDFTGTTLSGAPFDGAGLRGKPVVLWFWTPWCPFCNGEGPRVSAVSAANPHVTFVGVAGRGSVSDMENFVSRYGLNFTNLNDSSGELWSHFRVAWQPAYVFIKSSGTSDFVNNTLSSMPEQELSNRVKALT
jgi:thiol-disulfide isomerase/thioredoxin